MEKPTAGVTQKRWPGFLAFLLGLGVLTNYIFGTIFRNPGKLMLANGGDGSKNYFTYLYHVVYGQGTHFTGMNYPYGEHVVFTDNTPLLSMLLVWLRNWFPIDTDVALGIMHLLLPVNFIIGAVLMFKVLRNEGLTQLFAGVFALLITGLCPQLFRMFGHFSLSYTLFLPLVILLLQNWKAGRRNIWPGIALFVTVSVFSLFHVYYLIQALVTVGSYAFVSWCASTEMSVKQRLRWLVPPVAVVLCSFIFLKIFLKYTDLITDRTTYPWGMLNDSATSKQVFTSRFTPLGNACQLLFKGDASDVAEGYGYIGFVGLFIILAVFIHIAIWMLSRIKKQYAGELFIDKRTSFYLWWSLFGLLLAMGIPFVWGGDALVEKLSVFRQFRAMGRFVYIFYFLFSIAAARLLFQLISTLWQRQFKTLAIGASLACLLLWGTEVVGYADEFRTRMDYANQNYRDFFKDGEDGIATFLKQHQIDTAHYQAIIALPYFHIGSEKIWIGGDGGIISYGFRLSYQSGLPMTDVMMSRTSWSQTFENMKLVGGPYASKELLQKFNNKKILLAVKPDVDIDPNANFLVETADSLGVADGYKLYALQPAVLQARIAELKALALASQEPEPQTDAAFTEYFDDVKGGTPLMGTGAMPFDKDTFILADRKFIPSDTTGLYEISVWALIQDKTYRTPYFTIKLMDSAGTELQHKDMLFKESTDCKGLWFRGSLFVKVPAGTRRLQITSVQGGPGSSSSIDNLQVRPASQTIVSRNSLGQVMINNHFVKDK
jgi:hypothetical protein